MNIVVDVFVLHDAIMPSQKGFNCLTMIEQTQRVRVVYGTRWVKEWQAILMSSVHLDNARKRWLIRWLRRASDPNDKGVHAGPAAAREDSSLRQGYAVAVSNKQFELIRNRFYIPEMAILPFVDKVAIVFMESLPTDQSICCIFRDNACSVQHEALQKIEWLPVSEDTLKRLSGAA